jgi:N-acetylneuraminic acid mutarotase
MQYRILALVLCTLMVTMVSCSTTTSVKMDATESICSDGPSLPTARAGHAGGIVDGKLFIVGGNNWSNDRKTKNWLCDTYVFDNNCWQRCFMLPDAIADMMYAYDEDGLYICGGSDGTKKLNATYLFKASYKLPNELACLPLAIDSGGAAILNRTLYVACGATDTGLTSKLWRLDTRAQKGIWKECSPLPGPAREFPAVVACGNYLYVLGGVILQKEQPTMTVLRDTYKYDPTTDKWEKIPDLPFGGYAWSASAVDNKSILMTGRAFENSQTSNDIWLINVDNMRPQNLGTLQIKACAAPLIKVASKTWWYIGGEPDANRSRTSRVSIISLK